MTRKTQVRGVQTQTPPQIPDYSETSPLIGMVVVGLCAACTTGCIMFLLVKLFPGLF